MIHRPVTLTPSAQRRLADTQHAAGLSCTHALTSQRLDLLQLHNNLLRHVLRERPHGHPLCPATHGQDYSEQPSRNKRSENSDPSRCNTHLSGVTPLSDEPNHSQGLNHTRALHPLRGAAPLTWRCTCYVAVHPNRRGVMPTDRVHCPLEQVKVWSVCAGVTVSHSGEDCFVTVACGLVCRGQAAGAAPVTWRCTRYVALHPLRGAAPVTWRCTRTEEV